MGRNSALGAIAAREVRKIDEAKTRRKKPKSIYDVYELCSPELMPPHHLSPYCDLLTEAVFKGKVQAVVHAPPQHGKTLAAAHAFILFAIIRPGFRHAYSTYSSERAKKILNITKKLAFEAGLDPHSSGETLTLSGGTVIKFGGASTGTLTGEPVDGIHIIDDPIKDRKEAMSATTREDRWNWFHDVAQTRRHPGSSVVVMMTRWASDDLSGRIIRYMHWKYICLALVCESPDDPRGRAIGEVLWPEMRPEEWIAEMELRKQPLTWSSMYQGRPRPIGDTLFKEPTWYDKLPEEGAYRVIYGCDLAYTKKTRSDWSILLKGRMYLTGHLYLTNMWRAQVQAPDFTKIMVKAVDHERGPILWYGSSTERGVAQLIREYIPTFRFRLASEDKYVRATPTAEKLWNTGRVLTPSNPKGWGPEFCHVVNEFTGLDDPQDDEVDALAAIGDLAIQMGAAVGTSQLNRDIRSRMRGQLRA